MWGFGVAQADVETALPGVLSLAGRPDQQAWALIASKGKRGHVLTPDTTALDDPAIAPPTGSEPPNILTDTRRDLSDACEGAGEGQRGRRGF